MDDLTPEEVDSVSSAIEDEPQESTEESSKEETSQSSQEDQVLSTTPEISRAQFLQLEEIAEATGLPPNELERLMDVKVHVEVILGTTRMPIEKILQLHPGSVVELDKLAGEPVEILANGEPVARAEIVVIDDNFGIKILDIVGAVSKLQAVQSN